MQTDPEITTSDPGLSFSEIRPPRFKCIANPSPSLSSTTFHSYTPKMLACRPLHRQLPYHVALARTPLSSIFHKSNFSKSINPQLIKHKFSTQEIRQLFKIIKFVWQRKTYSANTINLNKPAPRKLRFRSFQHITNGHPRPQLSKEVRTEILITRETFNAPTFRIMVDRNCTIIYSDGTSIDSRYHMVRT